MSTWSLLGQQVIDIWIPLDGYFPHPLSCVGARMTQSQQPRRPLFTEFCLGENSSLYRYLMHWLYHHNHGNAYKQIVMHMTTACCNIFASLKHPISLLILCWVTMKERKRVQRDFALQKHGYLMQMVIWEWVHLRNPCASIGFCYYGAVLYCL